MSEITIIELWPQEDECCVCGALVICYSCGPNYGLAMYEDEIVPADWPGEWGGFTACQSCFVLFNDIKEPLPVSRARRMVDAMRTDPLVYPAPL